MKKLLTILLAVIICVAALTGCADPASSVVSGSSSAEAVPSSTPVPTTPPEPTPEPTTPEDTMDEDMKPLFVNGWLYYLDINDPAVTNYSEDPPMHMKKEDGSGDVQLEIRGFHYDAIGGYIYVDSNDPDVDENGTQTWSTTRMNPDGTNKVRIEYASMSQRLIPEGSDKFYFTTLGDSAIYVSDFACENVQTLMITIPDKSDIEKKLGKNKVMQFDITGVSGGYINFDVSVSAADGTVLYKGGYKTTMDGAATEKADKGEYYKYSANENE